jgi:hypothetical protein
LRTTMRFTSQKPKITNASSHRFVTTVLILAALVQGKALLAQTAVTYTGPNNGNWNTAANWSGGVVPINSGPNTYAVTIPAGRTVNFDAPGVALQVASLAVDPLSGLFFGGSDGLAVAGPASLGGAYEVLGASVFRAEGTGTTFNSGPRFVAMDGGQILVGQKTGSYSGLLDGTVFDSRGVVSGSGTNSLIDLHSLTQLAPTGIGGFYPSIVVVHAADAGRIDLRNVTSAGMVGGRSDDRLKFLVETGAHGNGEIRLDMLQTGTKLVLDVRVANFQVPSLTSLDVSEIVIDNGHSLVAPKLVAFTDSVATITGTGQLQIGPPSAGLANINQSRFVVIDGGALGGVTDASYTGTFANTPTLFEARGVNGLGSGSQLNLQSLTQLTPTGVGFYPAVPMIRAADGGTIDLRNVVTAGMLGGRTNDRLTFLVEGGTNGNGTLRLDSLETANQVTLDIRVPNFQAPSLTSLDVSEIIIGNGHSLTALKLKTFTDSVLTITGSGQLQIGPPSTGLSSIDQSRIFVVDGGAFGGVTDTSYTGVFANNTIFFEARGNDGLGTGSQLDLGSLTQLTPTAAGFYPSIPTIRAADGGTIDLRNLATAEMLGARTTDRLTFLAEGGANGNGTLRLDGLETVRQTNLEIRSGGVVVIGNVVNTSNLGITVFSAAFPTQAGLLETTGDLLLDGTSALSLQDRAKLRIRGDLSFETQNEANFVTDVGIIEMQGAARRSLEVGGTDLGISGATSGNFGIGQLVVGTATQSTTLVLTDGLNNGNRTGATLTDDEVLYLFGINGQNGLRIRTNSVVVLYGVDVYAYEAGTGQRYLNSLFPVGVNEIAYDQGKLRLMDLIAGDFSGDGVVDAVDFVVWRDTIGASGSQLRADANHDGAVTTLDYDIWRANFGNKLPDLFPGGGTGLDLASVPEPNVIGILIVAFIARGRRRH